jgi:hypothetical protein
MPAKSKKQQKFMGIVHSIQKGDAPASKFSKKAQKVAKSMKKGDAEDFASTKHKGLPNKVKREQRVRSLIKKMVREIMSEMNEGFAGGVSKAKRNKFDNARRKQSEVLGYKLTGTNDVKTEIDDATVKEGKLNEKCWKGYEKKGTKKMFGKTYPNCVKKKRKSEGKLTEKRESIFDVAARVLKNKQYEKYKGVRIDLQTANLLTKVYAKVNDKMRGILTKLGDTNIKQLINTLWAVAR